METHDSASGSTSISTMLPHRINGSVPKNLFTSSIFLLRNLETPQLPPWIVLSVESSKEGVTQFSDPFTRTLITNLPQGLCLTQFNSTHLASEYHVIKHVSSNEANDPFPTDSLFIKALVVNGDAGGDGVPLLSRKITLLTLFKGGQVYKAYPFDGSEYHAFEKAFHIPTFVHDFAMYNGKVYALCDQEKLHLYTLSKPGGIPLSFFYGDCGFYFDQIVVDSPIKANANVKRGRRRRLVVLKSSDNPDKLYMIVPVDDGYVEGSIWANQLRFEVKVLKENSGTKWVWETVTRFGDGDQVLFVSRDYCFFVSVVEFPGCHLSNCIVFSDDAFPEYCESECGWNYGSKSGKEVAVFPLEGLGNPYFPVVLWSTPIWLSQNASSSLQSQTQSREQSELGAAQSDISVEHKKPLESASEEHSTGLSSPNDAQSDSTRSSIKTEPSMKKLLMVKFQGIDVELEHLAILEEVETKYGDVVKGSAIHGCDAITMAWTSLAKILLILRSNSGNTLTDDQANYLSTTLSDLKFMQLKVDWLVPFVKKALAMHKNKQLQAHLAELEKAKAKAEAMEREFLSEMAGLRLSGPFNLEDCLDDGLF